MLEDVLKDILVSSFVFLFASGVLLLGRSFAFRLVDRWARKTETSIDNILLESVRLPSLLWAFAIGLYVTLGTSNISAVYLGYIQKAIFVVIVFSITLAMASLVVKAMSRSIEKSGLGVQVTGISSAVVNVTVYAVGILIIMNGLGIPITPLLTALGVGGLAVALALQDTLSNLFAGVHILMDKPLRVGDYVQLDSGENGYVMDIGWRTTKIRKLQNNIVIIPNSRIVQSIITNYHMPQPRMSLLIPVGVSYDSDPEKVEEVLLDVVTNAAEDLKGLLADPAPFVRFSPGFGDFSLDFTIICQVAEYVDQYLVQSELRKRIFKRFKKEGIEIPFPVRTIYMKQS